MATTQFQLNGYNHGGVLLNVAGWRDEYECVIERVTAADSQIDIVDVFAVPDLVAMGERVDAQLSREAAQANAEARAERHLYNREFAIA